LILNFRKIKTKTTQTKMTSSTKLMNIFVFLTLLTGTSSQCMECAAASAECAIVCSCDYPVCECCPECAACIGSHGEEWDDCCHCFGLCDNDDFVSLEEKVENLIENMTENMKENQVEKLLENMAEVENLVNNVYSTNGTADFNVNATPYDCPCVSTNDPECYTAYVGNEESCEDCAMAKANEWKTRVYWSYWEYEGEIHCTLCTHASNNERASDMNKTPVKSLRYN